MVPQRVPTTHWRFEQQQKQCGHKLSNINNATIITLFSCSTFTAIIIFTCNLELY